MQNFQGTLLVEEIHGRRGTFSVGTLQTSIGDFKVKDQALDQFKAGVYRGQFIVERIYTKGVPWRGGFFTELIAKISQDGFLIDSETDAGEDPLPVQAEPDPVDESTPAAPVTTSVESQPVARQRRTAPAQEDSEKLFGLELNELFQSLAPQIKLDPTVDRETFRRQRDRLKDAGYRFDSATQTWILPAN